MRRAATAVTICSLLLLARSAVTTTVAAPAPPTTGVIPYDEESLKRDTELLETAHVESTPAALVDFFQSRLLKADQREALQKLIPQLSSRDFDEREAAQQKIVQFGRPAIGLLKQAMQEPDHELIRRCEQILDQVEVIPMRRLTLAAARLLTVNPPENATETLLTFLPDADDERLADEIREVLSHLAVKEGKPDPTLTQALKSDVALRRGAAAEALIRGGNAELWRTLKEYPKSEADTANRFRALLALVEVATQKEVIPDLIRQLPEVSQPLALQGEDLLCRIARENVPNITLGTTPETRKAASVAWLDWFDKSAEKVDLAKLNETIPLLGHTVILEMNPNNQSGRLLELGADNKVLLKIDDLSMPMAAAYLPGNKVLIAEHSRNNVTEIDLANPKKKIWNYSLINPVSIQRLRNGHLVLAGRERVVELDRNRQVVFTYLRNQFHDIIGCQKHSSGDYFVFSSQGNVLRVSPEKKVLKQIPIGPTNYFGQMELLGKNRLLITQIQAVAEFDIDSGKALDFRVATNQPSGIDRLPNGNTLITSQQRRLVQEYDRAGKAIDWKYEEKDPQYQPLRAFRR